MKNCVKGEFIMQEVNVKVAVRVRPLLPKEKLAGESMCVRVIPSTNQLVVGKDRAFTFDHVLSSKTSQDETYQRCVEPLVRGCFEGYNATVFAYGQTGSGKTYTIGGGNLASQTEDEFGIIPRAIKDMFNIIQKTTDKLFTVRVSYIEIYKEELRDLLDLETSSKDLHVREDESGNTLIIGTTEVECENLEEVMLLLEQGSSYRHTASTQMNDHSSRSHSIFTLILEQKWNDTEDSSGNRERKKSTRDEDDETMCLTDIEHYMCAKFHFVDLAGSERAHRTGNVGDRFKESVHINSGLLALGNVISALGDIKKKASHIPYRESKITRLLKDSLGGNAQTLMICCISPSSSNFDESLNALKYANRAKNIKNKPIVNRDPQSIRFEEMQCEIKALREELQKQRTSLMTGTTNEYGGDMKKVIEDMGHMKQMEDKIVRLQTECDHYRMIAEEAYRQLTNIRDRDILSQSLNINLRDWLELMEEIKNKVPATLNKDAWENQTINRLEKELSQCRSDLKSDEEIFAEKAKEVNYLQEKLHKMESANVEIAKQLQSMQEKLSERDEQLVEKQVQLEELEARVKELQTTGIDLESADFDPPSTSGPASVTRRAKSVPVHMLGNRSARNPDTARNIHTSPAIFTLDRVMQGFRARSQLLISRLEDNDDVQQQLFSDDEGVGSDSSGEDDAFGATSVRKGPDKAPGSAPFQRNTKDRGTYKVNKPKSRLMPEAENEEEILRQSQTDDEKLSRQKGGVKFGGTQTISKGVDNILSLGSSAEIQKKKLRQHEIEVRQSTHKMRDLSINIKMKEQLIKELVKSSRDAQVMNEQYKEKIKALEKDKQAAKHELSGLQKAFQDINNKEQQDKQQKEKLQGEFRKKMETAKLKIHTLQKKQKDTERLASITGQNDKRINDLEMAVDRMRNQQEQLQKRLKEEVDHKSKLEREMEKEQKRIKELEARNEQQKKVLKVKTEENAAMQKRLRSGSQMQPNREEQTRVDEQRRYLDQEIEKVLEQRKCMDDLENELRKREAIIAKKESMLEERSELEIKKLRSSQVLNKDITTVASRLQSVEHKIDEKSRELEGATSREHQSRVKEELHRLTQGREKLRKQRSVLDNKLQESSLLSPVEERRLIELDEAIEALDAAIDYKNESIRVKQDEIRRSTILNQSDNLLSRLSSLSTTETRTLLTKYFDKVIDLREAERRKQLENSELEMKVDEQERFIRDLESTLQRQAIDMDRRLTQQQQQYEKKMQVLMQQIAESGDSTSQSGSYVAGSDRSERDKEREAKIQQLEKDLFYYKKTSRELKKKLREVLAGVPLSGAKLEENGDFLSSPRDSINSKPASPQPPASPRSYQGTPRDTGEKQPATIPEWDRLPQVRGEGSTPVRISRKDLRKMSEEEVKLRKSQCDLIGDVSLPTDSLEAGGISSRSNRGGKNPWT